MADFAFVQEHIRTVNHQVMIEAAQPHLQCLGIFFQQALGLFDEPFAIEVPVIFTVENPRCLHLGISGIDGSQLPQAWLVDEELGVRSPVFRNTGLYGAVAGVLGNEHLTNGSRVEPVKRLERTLQQIEATATSDYYRNVASLAEQHLFAPHHRLFNRPASQPQRQA